MRCKHEKTRQYGRDYGFSGSVAHPPYTEENPSAHGCISYQEECVACGARRWLNVNGCHIEYGTWGETESEREAQRRVLEVRAREVAPTPITLASDTGDRVTVRLDRHGMVCIQGCHRDERAVLAALPAEWLAAAQEARRAVLAAQRID